MSMKIEFHKIQRHVLKQLLHVRLIRNQVKLLFKNFNGAANAVKRRVKRHNRLS